MSVQRFGRLGLLFLFGVTAASSHAWTPEQQASHEKYLSRVGAVVGGCAANPGATGCPKVTKVVYAPSVGEESRITGYGPRMSAGPTQPTAASVAPGYQCGVFATKPQKYVNLSSDYSIRGRGSNQCFQVPGRPVNYQEVYATLERQYVGGTGGWQRLDQEKANKFGPGLVTTFYATYNCDHISLRLYRVSAFAYSVIDGVGFPGTNRKYEDWTCRDSLAP